MPNESWTIATHKDDTNNDFDKSFHVPSGQEWHILFVWVRYISDSTVGNRQLVIAVNDSNRDVTLHIRAGAIQPASQDYRYVFGPGLADLVAFRDVNWLMTPMPPTMVLKPEDIFRVRETTEVGATDDMHVHFQYGYRTI